MAEYELPPDAELRAIRLSNNSVYAVSVSAGTEPLVLRVHRADYRTAGQVEAELRILDHVAADGRVRAPVPVRTSGGSLVVRVADGGGATRFCDLLTWVDGRVLRPTLGLGAAAAAEMGRTLARLHDVFGGADQRPLAELPRWDAEALFTDASPFRPGPLARFLDERQLSLVQRVEDRSRIVFAELDREVDAHGLIHFDYILGNCRIRRRAGAWDVGVIDFDDCGWGYLLYDLAAILGNLADFPDYALRGAAFVHGYREVRDLPGPAEHLPVLMAARHVVSALCFAGRESRRPESVGEHVAYRMDQAEMCLALGDRSRGVASRQTREEGRPAE